MSKTNTSLKDVSFEFGRILNIYPERGTCDFRSEMSEIYRNDIPYTLPYFDQSNGTGIYFNPEPGCTAICAVSSDDNSMIFGFLGADEGGAYLCGRPQGNPGDIALTGKDGNFVNIRRGGILQIGAKPSCQTVYLPIKNIIQHFSENFEIHTLAGDMTYIVERPEDNSDGHSKCHFNLTVKEFTDDKSEIVSLVTGSQSGSDIFTLITKDKGNGNTKVTLSIDKDGNFNLTVSNNVNIKTKGDFNINTDGTNTIKSAHASMEATQDMSIKGGTTLTLKGDTSAELSSSGSLTLKGATISIGKGLFPILRLSPDMATWMAAVQAAIPVPVPFPTLHVDATVKA